MFDICKNICNFEFHHIHKDHSVASGQLSQQDIIREMNAGKLIITPLAKTDGNFHNIKGASFDISPSCLIMSVKRGRFLKIYSDISQCKKGHRNPELHCKFCKYHPQKTNSTTDACPEQRYVYINPRDTVLVLSREYIQLPNYICGNVFSRVSTVSAGLGHISTTIDPLWKGALLIAISNPSSERVKLVLQDSNENSIPLATVTLQYLNTPVDSSSTHTTHLPARVDILEKYLYNIQDSKSRSKILKQTFYRLVHINDYNLTVNLIDQLKKMKDIKPHNWGDALQTLENKVCAQKIHEKKWMNLLLSIIPFMKRILLVVSAAALIYALSPMLSNEAIKASDFLPLVIIAVLECILGMITTIIE